MALPIRRLLAGLLTISLVTAGCSTAEDSASSSDKPLVSATFTIIADMVSNVGKDVVEVHSITDPGAEIHSYKPTTGDAVKVSKSSMLFVNGLGLDSWFERFSSDPDTTIALTTEGISPLAISGGTYDGKPNPHAWMSPKYAETYITNIRAQLSEKFPQHKDTFAKNANAYLEKIEAIHTTIKATLSEIPESDRLLATCEGAFTYFTESYGLQEAYLWAINADQQGSPSQVTSLIDRLRDSQVPSVFCESTVSDKAMQQVAKETGKKVAGPLYVDSLSPADGQVPTYLDLLSYDADTILTGLSR